jgi:hypothetical protein
MKRFLALAVTSLGFSIAAIAQSTATVERAVESITADDVYNHVAVIAHDSMLGRDTPSPGLDQTAKYIAAQFEQLGLKPGGDNGTFIQSYPLRQTRLNLVASNITIDRGPTWQVGPDVLVRFGSLPAPVTGSPVVVDGATGGLEAVEAADLAGSIVILASPTTRVSSQLVQALFRQGPAAVISLAQRSEGSWSRAQQRLGRSVVTKAWGESRVGMAWLEVRESTVAPVLASHGYALASAEERAARPVSVRDLRDLELTVDLQYAGSGTGSAPNVVGILEGSDPDLRNEYVLFSAHMDHIGVRPPVQGDSIANGADDDASGTVAIIEMAEAYAMLNQRPRRSMIFLAVSGEEKGLWGSEYFAENPSVPLTQIVADLNADMISRNWTDTVVVIGKEHSDLGSTMNRVNDEHPELNMDAIDDLWPEERFYFRSDHYNFARKGVPILFFFTGTHEDYHQVTDEVDRINAEKAARIVKLMFYVGLEVANSPQRPQWDPASYNQIVELVP